MRKEEPKARFSWGLADYQPGAAKSNGFNADEVFGSDTLRSYGNLFLDIESALEYLGDSHCLFGYNAIGI
jgi:hypothetical protein